MKKKPGKARPQAESTEIVVLLDRSGSMEAIRTDMVHGFAAFVKRQQKVPGTCVVTLAQFDSHAIETVYDAVPVARVPELVLEPRGTTPLLDAMGRTISQVSDRLSRMAAGNRPARLLFLVMTDGHENASHEFTRGQIKQLVEQRQNVDQWVFTFLGANVDAFAEAGSLGVNQSAAMAYVPDARGVQMAFLDLAEAASSYRAVGSYSIESSDPRTRTRAKPK